MIKKKKRTVGKIRRDILLHEVPYGGVFVISLS